MDVTSLLNRPAGTKEEVGQDSGKQTAEFQVVATAATWEGLPTPSPERTPPRILVDCRPGTKSRTPWDAGGYSLPLSLDTKFHTTNTKPSIYGGDPLDISSASAHSAVTPLSFHSRNTSFESSPAEMILSALVSPMTTSRPLKAPSLAEPTSQLEISTSPR
ncbi:uncharacterized protein DNG_09350 [Cephalotrichum gorgonifer]|uniref:Uncharacterized protein n=1 Tax=Cephalotrichum gorgonifer TaxID=2041049 RepID=A0AAE8SZB5_9PEZI|nr:uncharacterized protein DNG_09350 [Cephalotrichum gorgonifer]